MKKTIPLLLLSTLSLISCGEASSSNASNGDNNHDPLYLDQNGDYATKSLTSYADLPQLDASRYIADAKNGLTGGFINASYSCSHCLNFEPIFLESLKKTGLYFSAVYVHEVSAEQQHIEEVRHQKVVDELRAYFGTTFQDGGIDYSYPRLYANESSSRLYGFDMYEDNGSVNKFTSYLSLHVKKTNIIHFTQYEAYLKAMENNGGALTLYYSSLNDEANFYSSYLYKKAKLGEKPLYYIDYSLCDEANKKSFDHHFQVNGDSLILANEKEEIKSESIDSLVSNYYD